MQDTVHGARKRVEQDALLAAAADLFFELGYSATSIDAIIERAGGSKRNIYSAFGSKEGLFAAIVARHAEQALTALAVEDTDIRDLRGTLMAFGCRLMDILMSPALLTVYRTGVAEGSRFPKLVREFYELGPGRASARLAQVLENARRRGDIRVNDCAAAADHFVGMIRGNIYLRVLLGLRPPPDASETRAIVASAVDLFMDGVQPRAGSR